MWAAWSSRRYQHSSYLRASVCIHGSIFFAERSVTSVADIRARFPRAFGPSPATRALRWFGALLFMAWLIALFAWFDITPARLSRGISGLFIILRQMIPPSPGAQWQDILQGLAEHKCSFSCFR